MCSTCILCQLGDNLSGWFCIAVVGLEREEILAGGKEEGQGTIKVLAMIYAHGLVSIPGSLN